MNADRTAAEAFYHEGNRHQLAGAVTEAERCFREALRLQPTLAEAHTNLGLLLEQRRALAEAEQHYRAAIHLHGRNAKPHLNLGALLAGQKRFVEAEAAYRRALALAPDSPAAWSNLGVLQAGRRRERDAERSYRQALALDAGHQPARFNLGYLLLRQGRFAEGWRCLEARKWRARLEKMIPGPRWQGEPLEGRSLLIVFEAGHGDMIQFCRYAAVLKAKGAARIILLCHPALKTLLATLESVDAVIALNEGGHLSGYDFWTLPLSIPLHCRTRLDSIPADLPYLRADARLVEKWSAVLAPECRAGDFRVGLVWRGNPNFENDADRSLPDLRTLEPLGAVAGARFISLQKDAGEAEAACPPAGLPVLPLGPQISDFADAAAVLENLDLVICVDTAIAHLAGAMGKPCWVLLPDYMTDWRWLTARADSPWYPRVMRLFRQPRMGEWGEVVGAVRGALRDVVASRGK